MSINKVWDRPSSDTTDYIVAVLKAQYVWRWNSKADPSIGAQTKGVVFNVLHGAVSETVQDRAWVVINHVCGLLIYAEVDDLERPWTVKTHMYAVTGNQKVICYGRNVRLMLVLLTYLLSSSFNVCPYTLNKKSAHLTTAVFCAPTN